MSTNQVAEPTIKYQHAEKVHNDRDENASVRIITVQFDEIINADCADQRYGCSCISHERCCGCVIQ